MTLFEKWLCGAVAAGISETLTMPLDVVKTRLQLTNELRHANIATSTCSSTASPHPVSPSLLQMGRNILYKEGVPALFMGTQAAVIRQALCGGIGVGLYQPLRTLVAGDSSVSFGAKVLCASTTGTLGQLVAAPTDVIKVRLQADARLLFTKELAQPRYTSFFNALVTIPKQEGFATFYQGLTPSLGRAAIMYGTSCAAYDHAKHVLCTRGGDFFEGEQSLRAHVASSAMSGLIASLVSTPFDVIKTRIINQPAGSPMYTGPIDCILKTVRTEGMTALYKGFVPTYLRLAPWQMIFFVTAEQVSLAMCGCSFTAART
jgi:hypothetical protein